MAEAATNCASALERSDMNSEQRKDLSKNLVGTVGSIVVPPTTESQSSSTEVKLKLVFCIDNNTVQCNTTQFNDNDNNWKLTLGLAGNPLFQISSLPAIPFNVPVKQGASILLVSIDKLISKYR